MLTVVKAPHDPPCAVFPRRFIFHHCLFDFQYTTDLADLGQVAFANCHAFHRNTHSSPSLNSSGWKRWHRTCMALNRHARSLFRSVSLALYRGGGLTWKSAERQSSMWWTMMPTFV